MYFQSMDKHYTAKLKFGIITDTWDIEGRIIKQKKVRDLNLNKISKIVASFSGDFYQTPPAYSAKKIKGKPAYYYARGKNNYNADIKLKKEMVRIHKIDIISLEKDILTLNIVCGSGTYIRSLSFEIGEKLGCGATLIELIRTKIGSYDLKNSVELNDLEMIASGSDIKNYNGIIEIKEINVQRGGSKIN